MSAFPASGLLVLALLGCGDDSPAAWDARPVDAAEGDAAENDAAAMCADMPDCSAPIDCPAPTGMNKVSVCGTIYDTQTTERITGAVTAGLEVRLCDPLGFNPPGCDPPLGVVYPDCCGNYQASDVTRPFNGFVAVTTDDLSGSPGDLYTLTVVATAAAAGETVANFNAFATRHETDAMWTTSAGLTGDSFATRGVYLPIFLDPLATHLGPFGGAPVAGVQITQGGSPDAMKDYYFSDADPLTRGTIDPLQAVTGTSGAGLWINGTLIQFSGTGGEPAGCTWPSTLAATAPGTVFVQERIATGGPCGM